MSTKVTLELTFIIPASEMVEIDEKELKRFVNQSLEIPGAEQISSSQFQFYSLGEFNPKISNLKITKV